MIKSITVEGIGDVVISRRKGTKHVKLSISGSKVRLSVPYAVSEQYALRFLKKRQDWITKHLKPHTLIQHQDRIGRAHTVTFVRQNIEKPRSFVKQNVIEVKIPLSTSISDISVQDVALTACKRALQNEAKTLLPQRTQDISKKINIQPASVKLKYMNSRWGHCSNRNDIVFSSYLIQLPWHIVDYVIVHELCHTIEHNHSQQFWKLVESFLPNVKQLKKELKNYQTTVLPNAILYK